MTVPRVDTPSLSGATPTVSLSHSGPLTPPAEASSEDLPVPPLPPHSHPAPDSQPASPPSSRPEDEPSRLPPLPPLREEADASSSSTSHGSLHQGTGTTTLISSDDVPFHVESLFLRAASPVFRNLFDTLPRYTSTPRPTSLPGLVERSGTTIQLSEPASTLRILLPLSMHASVPAFSSLSELEPILHAAHKYQASGVLEYLSLQIILKTPTSASSSSLEEETEGPWDPLRAYTLGARYDLPAVRGHALPLACARPADLLLRRVGVLDVRDGMGLEAYVDLVRAGVTLLERDRKEAERTVRILRGEREEKKGEGKSGGGLLAGCFARLGRKVKGIGRRGEKEGVVGWEGLERS